MTCLFYYRFVDLPNVQSEVKLRCVSTKEKGMGMVSECDIEQAYVIHVEEPFSVV